MGMEISKRYFSHSFRLTSTKFYDKYGSHFVIMYHYGSHYGSHFFGELPKIKVFISPLKVPVTQNHMVLKTLLFLRCHPTPDKFYDDYA